MTRRELLAGAVIVSGGGSPAAALVEVPVLCLTK